jgi:glycosyltransferase involved in cell wall biosynthesis
LAAVEAMAAGTPVIATDRSGAADLVRPEFGAIVTAGDHELLADAVLCALQENWKDSRGPVAAEYARTHHDLARNLSSLTAIYETVFRQRYGNAPA